jgi:hypothetical protein
MLATLFLTERTFTAVASTSALLLTAITASNNLEDHLYFSTFLEALPQTFPHDGNQHQQQPYSSRVLSKILIILPSKSTRHHLRIHIPALFVLGYLSIYAQPYASLSEEYLSLTSPRLFYTLSLALEITHLVIAPKVLDLIRKVIDLEARGKNEGLTSAEEDQLALQAFKRIMVEESWRLWLVNVPCFLCCLTAFWLEREW